jgi:outer membrane protein assembly factor BamB
MNRESMSMRTLAALLLLTILTGCSTVKGWFDKDDDKAGTPAGLSEFTASATPSKLWSVNAGKGEKRLGVRQRPAVADGRLYAAAVKGGVQAYELQSGAPVWSYDSDARLTGGPAAADGLVVVGGLDGEVVALDAATGAEKWRAKVSNEVITAPAIGQGLVLVRSNDGRVTAFDAQTGEQRWFYNNDLPSLTVRGNASVLLGPGVAFVGNDDGTLSAMAINDGRLLWNQVVGVPDGRTELERMADVDGAPILDGSTVFATSFKNETVAVDGPSGRPLWSRERGGAGGIGVAGSSVLVSDSAGTVWALDKNTGEPLWSNTTLARRSLTAPAVHGDYAVVGDFDGYVHWLRLENGELAARARAGGDAIKAKPVVADGTLLVQDIGGKVTAFGLQ